MWRTAPARTPRSARSTAPDGYTLLMMASTLTKRRASCANISYDPVRQFAQQGVDLQASPTPEHFTAFIKSETARAAKMLQEVGVKPE